MPMASTPRAQRTTMQSARVPRNFATRSLAASSPWAASVSLTVGRKAAVIVPSAVKRRRRLGRRKATNQASAAAPAPR